MSLGVKVYMSFGTMEALKLPTMINNSLGNGRVRNIGSFEIFSFDVRHDAREPLGFLITHEECGTIFFATDTHYIPWSFKDFNINHVMIECNYSKEILMYNNQLEKLKDRIIHSHFELEDVKEFFRANDFTELRDVVLLHLSNANSNAEQFVKEIEILTKRPVYVADKGLEVDFDLYKFYEGKGRWIKICFLKG